MRFAYLLIIGAAAFLATADKSVAQTLKDVENAEAAVVEAWQATPLTFRTTVIVEEPAEAFGIYKERESTVFKKGIPVIVYAEPVGYAWHDNGDKTYSFGFDIDLLLKKPDGAIIAGQENFQHLELTSRARNREFMLSLTLTVDGASAGDYIVQYTTRDAFSDKQGVISLPFSIAD